MRIVLLGPPGAGKGTQARRLATELAVPILATGDLLRKCIRDGTPVGVEAKSFMDRGALVPDRVVVAMVVQQLADPSTRHGFILDGFPRNREQAAALDSALSESGRDLDVVLSLRVDESALLDRIKTRVRESKGKTRSDDTPEVLAERIKTYRRQTAPLLDYYTMRGCLQEVDGMRSVEAVALAIRSAISAAHSGAAPS